MFGNVESLSGVIIEERIIDAAAEKAVQAMMSELPEEDQTYDVLMYVVKRTEEKIKGAKILIRDK